VEDRQEAASIGRRSQEFRACTRLNLMNACSRRNLTRALIGPVRLKTRGGASTNDTDCIQFDRTNETRKWGVSDRLWTGLEAKKGAAKWGSLTPRLPPAAVAAAAVAATRTAQGDQRQLNLPADDN